MPARRQTPVYILACGCASPYGAGFAALEHGLRGGATKLTTESFPPAGEFIVGRTAISDVEEQDRSKTLLHAAVSEISRQLGAMEEVSTDRRAVFAASSKGAFESLSRGIGSMKLTEVTADAPARWLAEMWPVRGPVGACVGACSTGLLNVFRGADALALGEADAALCGSTEASLVPLYLASFLQLGALSREGCFPFDRRHGGLVAGEGAAVFLLGGESAAARIGLQPLAVLRSWAVTSGAHHETGLARDGGEIARLLRLALDRAGLLPGDIDLLAAHGTGTPQGDAAEGAAVALVFSAAPPPVFSIKGAVGHLMGAAGSVELAACLATIRAQFAPATAGFESAAEECRGLQVLRDARPQRVRRVLKWSLGFGGVMTACVIEQP